MIEQSLEKQNICRTNDLVKQKFMNFPMNFCQIFKNTLFHRTPLVALFLLKMQMKNVNPRYLGFYFPSIIFKMKDFET